MRYDFSLGRGALAALLGALGAGGTLLFFAGLLVGTASAARRPEFAPGGDPRAAAAGSPAALPAAEPCPPAAAESAAAPAARRRVPEGEGRAAVAVFRDERRAVALLERMSARGEEAVIQAEAAADGEPVFRVLASRAAGAP